MPRRQTAVFLLIALSACTTPEKRPIAAAPGSESRVVGKEVDPDRLSEDDRNRMLSHGYALLHSQLSRLRWADEMLILKQESPATEAVVRETAEAAEDLGAQLEQLIASYPSLSLQDDGLPYLERARRESLGKARLLALRPVKGQTGAVFERSVLLDQLEAVDSMRHLALAIAENEKNSERRAFAQRAASTLLERHGAIVALLERTYFCSPGEKPR